MWLRHVWELLTLITGALGICENLAIRDSVGSTVSGSFSISTLDATGNPTCECSRPHLTFPGKIQLHLDNAVRVNLDDKFQPSTKPLFTISKEPGVTSAQVCSRGTSTRWILPSKYCSITLCSLNSGKLCELLNNQGVYNISPVAEAAGFPPIISTPSTMADITAIEATSSSWTFKWTTEPNKECPPRYQKPCTPKQRSELKDIFKFVLIKVFRSLAIFLIFILNLIGQLFSNK